MNRMELAEAIPIGKQVTSRDIIAKYGIDGNNASNFMRDLTKQGYFKRVKTRVASNGSGKMIVYERIEKEEKKPPTDILAPFPLVPIKGEGVER